MQKIQHCRYSRGKIFEVVDERDIADSELKIATKKGSHVTAQKFLTCVPHGVDRNICDERDRVRIIFKGNFHVGAIYVHVLRQDADNFGDSVLFTL